MHANDVKVTKGGPIKANYSVTNNNENGEDVQVKLVE